MGSTLLLFPIERKISTLRSQMVEENVLLNEPTSERCEAPDPGYRLARILRDPFRSLALNRWRGGVGQSSILAWLLTARFCQFRG